MSPKRAISYIQAFDLPPEEERFLVECDVRRKNYTQVAQEYNTSPEVIKRRRQRAYMKIADAIAYEDRRG